MQKIVVFDEAHDMEKTAEGLGVLHAVCSGACNACQYRRRCKRNTDFTFPADAACMIHKNAILEKWQMGCATCAYWTESDPRCMCSESQWAGRTVKPDNYCGKRLPREEA